MKEGVYYETKYWKVILHTNQAYLGYSLVMVKRSVGHLSKLSKEEWIDLQKVVKILESSYKKIFNATLFNWNCFMNNAYKSNKPKPLVHWHFRPRYKNKVEFAGEIFEDKEYAHHPDKKREHFVSKKVQKLIVKEIRRNIS
tara:strand:+ start:773 stop:1195 length:423 start_codon:yes stop_codon:yes gene_type:complete